MHLCSHLESSKSMFMSPTSFNPPPNPRWNKVCSIYKSYLTDEECEVNKTEGPSSRSKITGWWNRDVNPGIYESCAIGGDPLDLVWLLELTG